jgi:membrane protein insertase Oxa1/YidC/SpoIIIJ
MPIGVMLYWVTTNVWQIGQQAVIWREIETHPGTVEERRAATQKASAAKGTARPAGKGKKGGKGRKA